jgi:hypothetical protein
MLTFGHSNVLAMITFCLAFSGAAGQVLQPVDRRMDGRVLDASNQIGSGGVNRALPTFDPNAGNLIITGNVTAGRSFRGFSPIRDTNTLFTQLPSSHLSNFYRDSTGFADVMAGHSSAVPAPFFLPSQTVTSVPTAVFTPNRFALNPINQALVAPPVDPLTGEPISVIPELTPGWKAASPRELDTQYLPRPSLTTTPGPPGSDTRSENPFLAQSPLFGRPEIPGLGLPGSPDTSSGLDATPASLRDPRYYSDLGARDRQAGAPSPFVDRLLDAGGLPTAAELAPTVFGQPPEGDPLGRDAAGEPAGRADVFGASRLPETQLARPLLPPDATDAEGQPGQPTLTEQTAQQNPFDPAAFPSNRGTLYDDFRLAVDWSASGEGELAAAGPAGRSLGLPGAGVPSPPAVGAGEVAGPGFAEAPAPAPEGEEPPPEGRFDATRSYVQRLLTEAPTTFAGQAETNVNVRIHRAEALMREGEFYNSAAEYAVAAMLAPNDPLIQLGQGHAYLAAGDYISAVYHITRGLEQFPEVAHFRLDLYEFVSDPNILDIRRADLENKLERYDDYRLRFLLGYAEYYGGLREFGLDQLRQAAEEAPPDSVIARFPDLLLGRGPQGE